MIQQVKVKCFQKNLQVTRRSVLNSLAQQVFWIRMFYFKKILKTTFAKIKFNCKYELMISIFPVGWRWRYRIFERIKFECYFWETVKMNFKYLNVQEKGKMLRIHNGMIVWRNKCEKGRIFFYNPSIYSSA